MVSIRKVLGPGELGDFYGDAVAASGDTVVVGAPGTDGGGLDFAGAVYVYRRATDDSWYQEQVLTALDVGPQEGVIGDQFGFSVAIDGDRIVVGATHDDDLGLDTGAAYVFQRQAGSWTQTAKLTGSDSQVTTFFGNSVSVSGELIVVGPSFDNTLAVGAGAVYVFERLGGNWVEVNKLYANDAAAYDFFGKRVATDGSTIAVGAYGDDDFPAGSPQGFNFQRGAVYAFTKSAGAWDATSQANWKRRGQRREFWIQTRRGWSIHCFGCGFTRCANGRCLHIQRRLRIVAAAGKTK